VLGLLTRPVFPAINMGEPALLYCFTFHYLAAAGPGPWAIDRD
jgi:putative oxidoreductase